MSRSTYRFVHAVAIILALLVSTTGVGSQAAVPHPKDVFGFEPGADYKLADYTQVQAYLKRLDDASDRVQMIEIGKSALGKPLLLVFISSEENLKQLDRWKTISSRLARARDLTDEEARRLAKEGRAVVWVDGGLHATEAAHGQMTSLLAYTVATSEADDLRRIRDNVIVLLMPNMNPDGLDIVANWYRKNLGTPFETTSPPELYHHYVGHDNNRDSYMILQPETEAHSRIIYREWYPQIVYNHHQSGPFPGRINIPPFDDPLNPASPPLAVRSVSEIGAHMARRFEEEGKDGVVSRQVYDMWMMDTVRRKPVFHNMIGVQSETAQPSPTPRLVPPESIPDTFRSGRSVPLPARRPSVFYPNPWKGGWIRFRDAVDYMITASLGTLDAAALDRERWLFNIYRMGKDAIEKGKAGNPFAWVVPLDQWDASEAVEFVNVLRRSGAEVHRATSEFEADGKRYPAGSYIVYAGQPYRPFLLGVLEKQDYPDERLYPGGPPNPPYDEAGWTLPIQMGVKLARIEKPFQASADQVDLARPNPGTVSGDGAFGYALSHHENASVQAVNRLLAAGERVGWATAPFNAGSAYEAGTIIVQNGPKTKAQVEALARELGLTFTPLSTRPGDLSLKDLQVPRIGLYQSWNASMDEGWTRWLLERYRFPFDTLHDADIRKGDLARFSAIILPDQPASAILNGHLPGTMPPEYVGGIGVEGATQLKRYLERG
ncbi:MAG: peptidase M14, partial [Acidobacteria bacterium]|nr:peptidase M14 [Acidobacteriota bacterium]